MIYTSITALYDLGFISYKADRIYIEKPNGTKVNAYNKQKYHVSVQSKTTISIGVIKKDSKQYYCPERLFIELEKYPLENTIRTQALKNLEKEINPQKVNDIYQKIKNKRRGLNKQRVEQYLSKNLLLMYEILNKPNINKIQAICEYIIAMMATKDFPTSLIKGGTAVKLYINFKQSTEDVHKIVNNLENKENTIYFEISNKIDSYNELRNKKTLTLNLKAKSRKNKINNLITNLNSFELILRYV